MALKSGAQYLEEMKAMRPNVYKYGKLIEDLTEDPITKAHLRQVAMWYDRSLDPEYEGIYTTTSHLTGQKAHRWNTIMMEMEDLVGNAKMKREQFRTVGQCPGPVCAGWAIMNALWSVTYDMDKELVLSYFDNPNCITQFSLDTDWVKAVEEVKKK
jgi:4-hydroxybutyryl-CoA dehydratase/vinylacetyl-CoA-Delta-isomerase